MSFFPSEVDHVRQQEIIAKKKGKELVRDLSMW